MCCLTGSKQKLVNCYAKLKESLRDNLGITPKAATAHLYADFLQRPYTKQNRNIGTD